MNDLILLAIIIVILIIPTIYIIKAKKNGAHCIGCPDAKTCKGHCGSENVKIEEPNETSNDTSPPKCGGNCSGCSGGCR